MNTSIDIINDLAEFGFSSKEANSYLALLKLGSQPASIIAKELNLSRSTAQFILETLVKKQFANKIVRKKILYYNAEPPENLTVVMDMMKNSYLQKLEEKKAKINILLPRLTGIVAKELIFPKVKYYEGLDGVKTLYLELLTHANKGEHIDSIEEKGDMAALLGEFCHLYYETRVKKGIHNRVISPNDNWLNTTNKKDLIEARLVDVKKYPLPGDIKISETSVAIFDFTKTTPIGICIESKALVNHFKILFQLLWDSVGAMNKAANK